MIRHYLSVKRKGSRPPQENELHCNILLLHVSMVFRMLRLN